MKRGCFVQLSHLLYSVFKNQKTKIFRPVPPPVPSWLVLSSPDRGPGFGQDTTFTLPISTQVYKWVPANLMLGVTLQWTSIPSRVE